ncbi:hypothetical protein P0082_06675 [Candidatus Haliotispira prima]|uniref:DHHA2 domain-containing protein n=1 Tax=Candidatus Haliotispira prima TaxID=3034016 RepID=A0ABY8MDW2_9SPIO|nr:hypothetical protein P0082_06675 [Candidatus Haliotispira prima]
MPTKPGALSARYPESPQLYILPSEALDADALSSALLFAEIWYHLGQGHLTSAGRDALSAGQAGKPSHYLSVLKALRLQYSQYQLRCLLPLPYPNREELLWRRDINYLLQFIGQHRTVQNSTVQGQKSDPTELDTLSRIFQEALCAPEFTTECPPASREQQQNGRKNQSVFVLLDRHQLPFSRYQTRDDGKDQGRSQPKVIAIWDHRPDSKTLPDTELRCIQQATSCVSLLLDCTIRLGLLSRLSEAACLLAMATMHLDQQQHGGLLDWEKSIRQQLLTQLVQKQPPIHLPEVDNVRAPEANDKIPNQALTTKQLREIQKEVLQQRNTPDPDLFRQANTDVKVTGFPRNGRMIQAAIAVVSSKLNVLQELYNNDHLWPFVQRCLDRRNVDFLVLLHRQSTENPCRTVSLFFYPQKNGTSPIDWDAQKAEFLLVKLQKHFPCRSVYHSSTNKKTQFPALVQLEQLDQSLSRKAFMPAFQQSFTALLEHFKKDI